MPAAGFALFVVGLAVLARVGEADIDESTASTLRGEIEIDGSSTVGPITQAVAEEFGNANPRVLIAVGVSGTGGGFKRFTTGETEISNASRTIKLSEIEQAATAGIEFAEVPVAYDGLSVVVNASNRFVDCLTTEELRLIWRPGSTVTRWSDIRSEWPDTMLRLYGPGTASGTFEYFTEAIVGESGASRPDYTASEDDNVLVQGIAGDGQALGYFGYAFYAENRSLLGVVAVDSGDGCVAPSQESISNGAYSPLSRPLYIYVNRIHLTRPEVLGFLDFYISNAPELVPEVGYVPLTGTEYEAARELLE
jgi:phosphate transport system substrate-binding protein